MPRPSPERYFTVMAEEEPGRRSGNLRFHFEHLFRGVSFPGKQVLDVGAGNGQLSFYAVAMGAQRVVALEPEKEGWTEGDRAQFQRIAHLLGTDQVELQPVTLQEYEPGGDTFDMLILKSSINHLDEDACIRLHQDSGARATYRKLFAKLADLTRPGAWLIATDCSPHNFFAQSGLKNPIAPSIEWHTHQRPQLWVELLEEAGFRDPRIRWESFNTLRSPGRVVLGNRVASYFLNSAFALTMRKGQTPATALGGGK
jgi:SAM-dependent methyltransferase